MLSDEYREQLWQMHAERKFHGDDAVRHLPAIVRLVESTGAKSAIDYGCGCARLAQVMPIATVNYDPGVPEFDELPQPADLVISLDVLEHIEPDQLDDVLKHIQSLGRWFYIHIATRLDRSKLLPDGRNPHLIVWPAAKWRSVLGQYFKIAEWRSTPRWLTVIGRRHADDI